MSVNKHPRLYVRVKGEELRRWHEWADERNMIITKVIQHVFRKGRLPPVQSGLPTQHLDVELIRLRFYTVRAQNNLKQIERLLLDGSMDGDLEAIREALQKTAAVIAELDEASYEIDGMLNPG